MNASDTSYCRVFETAHTGILILDADTGRIVDVNPVMVKMLASSRAGVLGKELWELGGGGDVAASKAAFLELKTTGYIRYDARPFRTTTGQPIDVECVGIVYLVDDKKVIQCNVREITRRTQAVTALRKSERLTRNLVEHLPHGILIKDRKSVILFCNANCASDWDFRPGRSSGRTRSASIPGSSPKPTVPTTTRSWPVGP